MLKVFVSLLLVLSFLIAPCVIGNVCAAKAGNEVVVNLLPSNHSENTPCKDASGVGHHCVCKQTTLGNLHYSEINMVVTRHVFFVADDVIKHSFISTPPLKPPSV